MGTRISTRFSAEEIALIGELITAGVGDSRSAVIRQGLHKLAESVRRVQAGREADGADPAQPPRHEVAPVSDLIPR